jgi:hypothetical protein
MHGSMGGGRKPLTVGHAARQRAPPAYPTTPLDGERRPVSMASGLTGRPVGGGEIGPGVRCAGDGHEDVLL